MSDEPWKWSHFICLMNAGTCLLLQEVSKIMKKLITGSAGSKGQFPPRKISLGKQSYAIIANISQIVPLQLEIKCFH